MKPFSFKQHNKVKRLIDQVATTSLAVMANSGWMANTCTAVNVPVNSAENNINITSNIISSNGSNGVKKIKSNSMTLFNL